MRDPVIDPVEDAIFPVKDISVPVEINPESTTIVHERVSCMSTSGDERVSARTNHT
jgi:hypothetical protein